MVRVQLIALLIIAFANFHTAAGQNTADIEKLDSYFKELQSYDRFSGSVILMKGDDILFQNAYGSIDKDGTPATPQSLYRIASITKSYTAAIILRFIEQGDLSLNTTLNSYFPGIPSSEQITIEQLLRHQSGLAAIADFSLAGQVSNSIFHLSTSLTSNLPEAAVRLFIQSG